MTSHEFVRRVSGKGGGIAAMNVYTLEDRRYGELERYKYAEFRVHKLSRR
jgi:hypothetical protein